MLPSRRDRWLCTAAVVALLPLQLVGISRQGAEAPTPSEVAAPAIGDPAIPVPHLAPRPILSEPAASDPLPVEPEAPVAPAAAGALVTEAEVLPASRPAAAPAAPRPGASLAERYPAQAAAVQDPSRPATTRWALLIGINEHLGRVADNIGSRQDAEDLRALLLANGWLDDHILLITDRDATGANIRAGIEWLADKTDRDSVAIFHYSGHSKKWYGRDHDGDGEITDEGLWPTDDRFIVDSELVRLLDPVRPHAFWVSFATCNAAGLADPGLARPGRILTFSSGEPQKSYEHPEWGNSVWGWFLIEQAMILGRADADGDGRVTVEEAFRWARPRASVTTSQQSDGPQDGVIVDLLDGDFDVLIPGVRPMSGATPPAADQPPSDGTDPPPPSDPAEPDEPADDRRVLCLLCGR